MTGSDAQRDFSRMREGRGVRHQPARLACEKWDFAAHTDRLPEESGTTLVGSLGKSLYEDMYQHFLRYVFLVTRLYPVSRMESIEKRLRCFG